MYHDLWSILPGNVWVKVATCVVAVVATIVLLLEVIFPAISPRLPGGEAVVGQYGGQSSSHSEQSESPQLTVTNKR